jgi:hypothetical protein
MQTFGNAISIIPFIFFLKAWPRLPARFGRNRANPLLRDLRVPIITHPGNCRLKCPDVFDEYRLTGYERGSPDDCRYRDYLGIDKFLVVYFSAFPILFSAWFLYREFSHRGCSGPGIFIGQNPGM